jgi:hypothetical protein
MIAKDVAAACNQRILVSVPQPLRAAARPMFSRFYLSTRAFQKVNGC